MFAVGSGAGNTKKIGDPFMEATGQLRAKVEMSWPIPPNNTQHKHAFLGPCFAQALVATLHCKKKSQNAIHNRITVIFLTKPNKKHCKMHDFNMTLGCKRTWIGGRYV